MNASRLRMIAAVLAAATVVGCAHTATTQPAPATSTGSPTSSTAPPVTTITNTPARPTNWTALQAGDCLAEPPPADPAVVMVTVVDCTGPHLAETFARVGIPVDAALADTATARCEEGFVAYTGRASAGSGYAISYLIDSEQDRTSNNPLPSTVICLLQGAAGAALTGSARA